MQNLKAISGQRLVLEWRNWNTDQISGFKADPLKNPNGTLNLRQWRCLIPGPQSSPWEGGKYKIKINFPDDFPVMPPICWFDPPVFHPNVSPSGEICIPELCEKMWRSYFTIEKILCLIQNMLENPNIFEAANNEVKQLYLSNFREYERLVRKNAMLIGADGEAKN